MNCASQCYTNWGTHRGSSFWKRILAQRFVSQEIAVSAYLPASSTAHLELCRYCPNRAHSSLLLFLVCKNILCWPTDNWDQGAEESLNTMQREDMSVPLHQIWKKKRWQLIITCNIIAFSFLIYPPWQLEMLSQKLHQQLVVLCKVPAFLQNTPFLLLTLITVQWSSVAAYIYLQVIPI